jgi:predicted phage terminase large subunit-like protein
VTTSGVFPSGATLTFGYLENERDKYRYQSAEFQFIGFDELTEFGERQYLYLFSRLRRGAESTIPLRMRSASNPGGVGHEWVRARFVDGQAKGRLFIPARLDDNPYLDRAQYRESLSELDPVTRAQLLDGDWQVRPQGVLFKREWFTVVEAKAQTARRLRYWDKAATEGGGARTAGVLIAASTEGLYCVEDVVLGQWSAHQREEIIRATAERDGPAVAIWLEQEPGSGGKESAEASIRSLAGFSVHADRVTGAKLERAQPLAAQCEAGNVRLLRGHWNQAYLEELCSFPLGSFCDQVDASSGAFNKLSQGRTRPWTIAEIEAYGESKIVAPDGRWLSLEEQREAKNADQLGQDSAAAAADRHEQWLRDVAAQQAKEKRRLLTRGW